MLLSFKDHYVNIVEKSCKNKRESFASLPNATDIENVLNEIIQYYNDHPRIIKITENFNFTQLNLKFTNSEKINMHRQNSY